MRQNAERRTRISHVKFEIRAEAVRVTIFADIQMLGWKLGEKCGTL